MKKKNLKSLKLNKKSISNLDLNLISGGSTGAPCTTSTGPVTACDTAPFSKSDLAISCDWCPDGQGNNQNEKR